jgi:ABC-type uncharacterized transport system substrate-binding protein
LGSRRSRSFAGIRSRIGRVSDPVGLGFVETLARPGGNVTGFTTFEFSPVAKLLEALKEIAAGVMRVALIFNPALAFFRSRRRILGADGGHRPSKFAL